MEGRERGKKKNYTEVLEENDWRNVFNLKSYIEKIHSCRTVQWEQLFYSSFIGVVWHRMATVICHRNKVVSMQMATPEQCCLLFKCFFFLSLFQPLFFSPFRRLKKGLSDWLTKAVASND